MLQNPRDATRMVTQTGKRAFTLTELLVVIGIIALLAAILVPVFASVRENGRRAICASNVKQIGAALLIYAQDNDEQNPNSKLTLSRRSVPVSLGWAGRIYPYVKDAQVYHCPDDPTETRRDRAGKDALPVSYGLNANLSLTPHLAAFTAPSKTVWLFEVVRNHARVQEPDEGAPGLAVADQVSAAGDGTDGGLLDVTQVAPWQGRTQYATGKMDNAEYGNPNEGHDYLDTNPRHRDGANYLAADGHVVYLTPERVSAGGTAQGESSSQMNTGCPGLNPAITEFPCAEGTAVGKHTLTFSVR